jgi:hypothetical protein
MNWLTERLAALESFGPLHERAVPIEGSLRRLPVDAVGQAVQASNAKVDFGPVQPLVGEAYLFTEEMVAAGGRPPEGRPAAPVPGFRPAWYTVGLADPDGFVLYLPDDVRPTADVQLFLGGNGTAVSRVHLTGQFAPEYAHLTEAYRARPDACADGPCRSAAPGSCRGDCECLEFWEETAVVRDRLRNALGVRGERHAAWVERCHRWPPA